VNAYTPPTQDQLLAIRINAGIEELARSDRFAHAEPDLVEAIVEGVGQFAELVITIRVNLPPRICFRSVGQKGARS